MTENEIIEFLKQNKEKGIAFGFMPAEVQEWCGFHSPTTSFRIFNGVWSDPWIIRSFNTSNIYCLVDDFEPKPKFKSHWEEFDIDQDGRFELDGTYYFWHQWSEFLLLNTSKYNNFGGWLFGDLWSTKALMTDTAERELFGSVGCSFDNVIPVMPTKIRFWRYKEE